MFTLPGCVDVCGSGSWLAGLDAHTVERVRLVSELQRGAGGVQLQNAHQQQRLRGRVLQRDGVCGPGQRRVQLHRRHVSRRRRQESRQRETRPHLSTHPITQLLHWPQRHRRPTHTVLTHTHRFTTGNTFKHTVYFKLTLHQLININSEKVCFHHNQYTWCFSIN